MWLNITFLHLHFIKKKNQKISLIDDLCYVTTWQQNKQMTYFLNVLMI